MNWEDRVTINTHSSIRLAGEKFVVYIDPFRLETAPRDGDVIFITHSHFDHFSPEDIAKAARPDALLVAPESMRADAVAESGIDPSRIFCVEPSQEGTLPCGLHFKAVHACNMQKPFHPPWQDWVGYVITLDGGRYYITGDTDFTETARNVRCDCALLPVGGKYTMDAAEAAALAKCIQPEAAIPTHYGSVAGSAADGDTFCRLLQGSGIRAVKKIQNV